MIKRITLGLCIALLPGFAASLMAQCPQISCPADIVTANDPAGCGAVVNYTAPQGTNPCGTSSQVFNYTGTKQVFVVPAGVTQLDIEVFGAQGGANWINNNNYGGYAYGSFSVAPGDSLFVWVGGQASGTTGGFNGGGDGDAGGQGGGGATDVRLNGNTLNDRLIVAGGGGGAGYWNNLQIVGGVGGGTDGGNGYREPSYNENPGGLGASQSGPGANGTCASVYNPNMAGGFGYGGTTAGWNCGCEGYGGGGGWYGGAASGNCRGGGGGSGYVHPSATNVVLTAGQRTGHGEATISWTGGTATTVMTAGLPSGSTFPQGVTTITYKVTDGLNNSDSCSFTVTVNDTSAPVVICPSDLSVCAGDNYTLAPLSVSDNCNPIPVVSYLLTGATSGAGPGVADSAQFNPGTTTITYTVDDGNGNSAQCAFNFTLVTVDVTVQQNGETLTATGAGSYQWINCQNGLPLAGADSSFFSPAFSGSFAVIVTNGSCSDTSACYAILLTGVNDRGAPESIHIFPNPGSGTLTIDASWLGGTAMLQISDARGQLVYESPVRPGIFHADLQFLPAGVYFLNLRTDGRSWITKLIRL